MHNLKVNLYAGEMKNLREKNFAWLNLGEGG